jgi:hypothetical protein
MPIQTMSSQYSPEPTTTTDPTSVWKEFFLGTERQPITLYTFFHFLFGIICAFWFQISFEATVLIQLAHEIFENSSWGHAFWTWLGNTLSEIAGVDLWSGYKGDSVLNSNVDTLAVVVGYWIGRHIKARPVLK